MTPLAYQEPGLCSRAHTFVTGETHRTDVVVESGALRGNEVQRRLGLSERSNHFLITDETVARLHGSQLSWRLRQQGANVTMIIVPDGEHTKSLAGYATLAGEVLQRGPDEESTLIAFGGGMVCNLVGMLAATLYRGTRLVHVPTTLMAQCDAAISHKQAINTAQGKNLLGAYYAPDRIIVDPEVLRTLRFWQLQDGFAEIIKHALAQDEAYLDRLCDPRASLRDAGFLSDCVGHNIRLKCELMRTDPAERNEGMVLQYGHTLGHAVEHASGYELGHGQSVAIGMMFAAHVAHELGIADCQVVERHLDVLCRYGLPTKVPRNLGTDELMRSVSTGKRRVGETALMALVARCGVLYRAEDSCAIPITLRRLRRLLDDFRMRGPDSIGVGLKLASGMTP